MEAFSVPLFSKLEPLWTATLPGGPVSSARREPGVL